MDKQWVSNLFAAMAKIGQAERGFNRLAYSDADWEAKALVKQVMTELGMTVRMDSAGNMIGRLEGKKSGAPAVAAGSHVDGVPQSGNYDGIVGVIGALCAVKRIKEGGLTTHPLEILVFAGHESSRFGFAHLGSRSIAGISDPEKWQGIRDQQGYSVPEVLAARGLDFTKLHESVRKPGEIKAFMELHIEQGPVLEAEKVPIGIVTDIAAPIRLSIKISGNPSHSGTTPMDKRNDALITAAHIVLAVRQFAVQAAAKGVVGTVGMMTVKPGAMNIVPGFVEMWVDIRGITYESVLEVVEQIKASAVRYEQEEGTKVTVDIISSAKPVHLSEPLMDQVKAVCEKLGVGYRYMIGGGGHDSQNIALIAPTGVIHIPCRAGISHTPEEYAAIDDIMTGIDVLTETLAELAR